MVHNFLIIFDELTWFRQQQFPSRIFKIRLKRILIHLFLSSLHTNYCEIE